jgi:hypothetical protein
MYSALKINKPNLAATVYKITYKIVNCVSLYIEKLRDFDNLISNYS